MLYISNFLDDKFSVNFKCQRIQALYLTFREQKNLKAIFNHADPDMQAASEVDMKEVESSKSRVETKMRTNTVTANPFMNQEKSSIRKEDRKTIFNGDTMSACSINDEAVLSNHMSPIRTNNESKGRYN